MSTYRSLPDAFVALRTNEVDALVFPAEAAEYLRRELEIESGVEAVGPPLREIPRGVAVRKDRGELLKRIDQAFDHVLTTPEFTLMRQRWFPRPEPWWTWRHTLILLTGLALAAGAAAALLHNIAMARDFMEPLHTLGCRFALDDFGVGFSLFEYLRLLPVDFVKIDGSFIRNLPDNQEDQAISRAITEVAHATGRRVIAELVESQVHADLLTGMGLDYAQGYHIGRPAADPPHVRPAKRSI